MSQPPMVRTDKALARLPRLVMCHKLREAFSPEECARVIEAGKSFKVIHGVVGAKGKVDSNYRESQIAWLGKTDATSWIYDRIFDLVGRVNREPWRFDIASSEVLQFATYGVRGHYDWHLDLDAEYPQSMRKITVSVQLSDPASYDGGNLEMCYKRRSDVAPRDLGTVTVFPSYVLHRVTPIRRGFRCSLNAWIVGGAPFK